MRVSQLVVQILFMGKGIMTWEEEFELKYSCLTLFSIHVSLILRFLIPCEKYGHAQPLH